MPITHTPGPWSRDVFPDDRGLRRIYGDGLLVATLDPPQLIEEVAMKAADARLIAAAPELLAALVETVKVLGEYTGPSIHGMNAAFENALSAIAKATGGAS